MGSVAGFRLVSHVGRGVGVFCDVDALVTVSFTGAGEASSPALAHEPQSLRES
jgi:hypothetical protein